MVLPEFEPSDRFILENRIGSGGMGDIFKGIDQETGQAIAIKILRQSPSPQERVRFAREIAILADLRHPNIVQYIAHGTWQDGRLFFAMEWLDGEDLSQRQRRAPLGMRDAVEVVRRSSAAMAAVHSRGVIHRDLKLSNIFLLRNKGTAVKLIDFGVVKPPVPDEYPTPRGTIIGTPHFMAPEQARGEVIDTRADVYSLGSVLFRLVTGRNVFETEHVIALLGRLVLEDPPAPNTVRFDVPEALNQVIHRAIARNRDDRFPDGGEFARALARVGTLNNDPPATDRSASAIRKTTPDAPPPITLTESAFEQPSSRPGTSERRVVAAVLVDYENVALQNHVDRVLCDMLGEDTRVEPLVDAQMVAVLGVERSRGDEAMRAARAALTVAHTFPQARIVVAVGRAVRGRANLAGEALERAARQLELSSPGAVRTDTHAAGALEGRFIVQRDQQGSVLIREDAGGFVVRQLLGRPTPTVGREKEIALLQGIYAELVEDGTPRAALVIGTAGIGKSRVRSELTARLETSAVRPSILLCRGDPMSRGTSLSILGRTFRSLIGIYDGEPLRDQVYKVQHYVAALMPQNLWYLAPFLGELVGVSFPDEADEPLRAARMNTQLMQTRMRSALEAYARALTSHQPLVFIIEDMQWIDDTTLELLDWLLGCVDLRLGVFSFARPEIANRTPPLWERRNVTRLTLSPLSPLAADRLVAAALPTADQTVRANIVRRAGGNALFLEELVRCAAEGRDDLPLNIQAVIQLRLDRMSNSVRQVLRAAAIFGQSFWTQGIEALLERKVDAELGELQSTEIIARQPESRIAGQEEWIFRQALVRDAAYASILDEDRSVMHLSAGGWLESVGNVDAGLIALHADAGGDRPRAATLYARATRQALSNGAQLETAYELANRGLACEPEGGARAELLLTKAHCCYYMGRTEECFHVAEDAAQSAPPGSDMWGEAQRLAAAALIDMERSAEGDARAAWALHPELSAAISQPLRATLLAVRVRSLVHMQRPMEALQLADYAVEAARVSGSLDATLRTLEARLFAVVQINDFSEAITAGTSLIQAADSAGDVVLATRARLNTASVLNHLGMFEDAQSILERALNDSRIRRMRIHEAVALLNLGMSLARLGHLDEGVEYQRQAARIAEECNSFRIQVYARVYESVILVWRGAPGDLGTALNIARYVCDATREQPTLYIAAVFILAHTQLARRSVDSALEAARDAYQRLSAGPVEEWEELIRLTFIEALLYAGETEEADTVLEIAWNALIDRVESIRRRDHRQAFLNRVGEVRKLVALADARLHRQLPSFT